MYTIKKREIYNPEEEPTSRYFHNKSNNAYSQPFLITLFQAVMAFKRIAKLMKKRHLKRNTKYANGKSILREIIKKSDVDKYLTKFGQGQNFAQNIEKPEIETVVYRATSDGHFLKLRAPQSSPYKTLQKPLHRRGNIIEVVAKKVSQNNAKLAVGGNASAGDKLNSLLDKQGLDLFEANIESATNLHKGSDATKKGDNDIPEDLVNLISKNFTLSANKIDNKDANKVTVAHKEITEYMPGTFIYFGATIALQATHGGYLSYHDPVNVKASAHKILQSARFLILNSDDLTDLGVLRYGDAIWLQAGLFDVLGASFVGSPAEAGSSRKIRPALINSRRENMFKAQQYGRWIVLKRDDPIGSIGQQVSHLDKILLEQEWYFLCSLAPSASSMWRTKADVDELTKTGKGGADLFNPISECSWKMHLVKLPKDDISNEKERQRDAQVANEQLKISGENRLNYGGKLSKVFNDMMDANVDNTFLKKLMAHKETNDLNLKKLADIYVKKAQSNWDPHWISLDFLSVVYGKNSIVTKMKEEVIKYKSVNLDYAPPTIRVERIKSKLYKLQSKYWDLAGGLLQNTKATNEMPSTLEQYYITDLERKIKAARILQRCVRRYLHSKFSFRRALLNTEKQITEKIKNSIREKKKIILEQEANLRKISSNSGSNSGSNSNTGVDPVYKFFPIDSLGIFDNPNLNNADQSKLATSKRAANMYSHLNGIWEYELGERHYSIHKLYEKNRNLLSDDQNQDEHSRTDTSTRSNSATPSRDTTSTPARRGSTQQLPPTISYSSPPTQLSSQQQQLSAQPEKAMSRLSQSTSALPTQVQVLGGQFDQKPVSKIVTSASAAIMHHTVSYSNDKLFTHTEASNEVDNSSFSNLKTSDTLDFEDLLERKQRPKSGNATRSKVSSSVNNMDSQARDKLMRTKERDYGLPKDVFENTHSGVNMKTGMKFLRAMSKDPDALYGDIKLTKKNRAHSAPSKREK